MKNLFLITILFVLSLSARGQDFTVKSFHVSISLFKEGYITVNEKITVDFPAQKRGIIRDIPYEFRLEGKKYKTPISDINVAVHPFKVSKNNGNKSIRIGDADVYLTGQQVYDITYKVEGPFLSSPEYSEFYWNITGNAWTAPIEKVSFEVLMPDDLAVRYNDLRVFTGQQGSTEKNASIAQNGRVISGQTSAILQPGQGLTLAIKLPLDYVQKSSTLSLDPEMNQAIPINNQWPWAAIPAGILAFFLLAWKKLRGNDDDDEMVSQPYPPLDLTPAEVGAFYDHIVHDRDVISLLPYWAYQGFITIAYDKSSGDMRLTKVKDLEGERPTYEYTLFNGLFDFRSIVELSDLKYKFYSTQTQVKSQIRKEIIDLQMYDDQYRYWFKTWRIWLFLVCLIPIMVLSFIFGYWMAGIVVIFAMIAVIVVASVGSKTSEKGRRVKQELRGFHAFLKNDDTSQYPDLIKNDPSYFEKVYPYALAFGLDKSWLSKIKPYQTIAPMWYGYYGIYAHDYNRSMDSFSEGFSPREISSAFTTMPASSGGSGGGFSGGSSGGGFGGGGGSSW